MSDRPTAFYALLVEGTTQGPILMETEMEHAGQEAVEERLRGKGRSFWNRAAMVRCEFQSGNRLLFDQMCDGAERHDDKGETF